MSITPRQLAEAAVRVRRGITIEEHTTTSHRVAVVRGLEDAAVIESLSTYLVGAGFARAVRSSLKIAGEFLDLAADEEAEITRSVEKVLGADNNIDADFKSNRRDPWIAEGIAHLVLWLSRRRSALAARGSIQALTQLHVQPMEQGIDLAALYTDADVLGVHIGESKASATNATSNVRDAALFFREFDAGDAIRLVQLRSVVQLLRESLKPDLDGRVTKALWEEQRCYGALVVYGDGSNFSPARARNTYRNLSPGPQHVLLVCLCLADYGAFFDDVAEAMRNTV